MIQQILFITLETIFETVCFNYSLQHGYYFFTAFFGYLLFRRLWTTYVVSRIARSRQIYQEVRLTSPAVNHFS